MDKCLPRVLQCPPGVSGPKALLRMRHDDWGPWVEGGLQMRNCNTIIGDETCHQTKSKTSQLSTKRKIHVKIVQRSYKIH